MSDFYSPEICEKTKSIVGGGTSPGQLLRVPCALAGAFAAGAPTGLGRGDLEPHRDLVLIAHRQCGLFNGNQVVDTDRRGERNHARTEIVRARVNPAVTAAPAAGRSALESHQQGHRAHGAAGRGSFHRR